jgi:hypothetical protein
MYEAVPGELMRRIGSGEIRSSETPLAPRIAVELGVSCVLLLEG